MNSAFDLIIVGGGLVGRVAAIAFAQRSLRVAMIEREEPTCQLKADYDTRSIALAYGSVQTLTAFNLWQALYQKAIPINQVHVSDQGQFGLTRMHAKDYQLPALGYVIEMPNLINALIKAQQGYDNITVFAPAMFESMKKVDDRWQVEIDCQGVKKLLSSEFIIAADGVQSSIRGSLGIEVSQHDYQKTAIVANIGLARSNNGIAYERFTQTGPIALLPIAEKRYGVVWSVEQDQEILNLSDQDFLQRLQRHFGYRAGRFTQVGKRFSYPLKSVRAKQQAAPGVILMGNAAHNLAPFAAQGFNLSLRDVGTLIKLFNDINYSGKLDNDFFARYEAARKFDQKATFYFTHSLATLFNPRFLPTRFLRNVAMASLDILPFAKRLLAWQTMGL